MIKLSIIVPVYNVEQYIDICLNSIYSQNVEENCFEVIVVNDGSPDASMSIVARYARKHSNFRMLNQENQGLSMARNNGFDIALGKYVWFVDSDDWLSENSLATLLNLITQYDYDVFATPLLWIYERDNSTKLDFKLSEDIVLSGKDYLFKKFPYGASQRFVMKRAFYLKQGLGFSPNVLHEDGEFGPKMLYLASEVYLMSKSVYNYRIRISGSIMCTWRRKNSDDLVYIHKRLLVFCETNINDSSEQILFKDIIFNTLIASIIFAKDKWGSKEFKSFYAVNRSYIRDEATRLLFLVKEWKLVLKYMLYYISPLLFLKFKQLFR